MALSRTLGEKETLLNIEIPKMYFRIERFMYEQKKMYFQVCGYSKKPERPITPAILPMQSRIFEKSYEFPLEQIAKYENGIHNVNDFLTCIYEYLKILPEFKDSENV